MNSLIPFKTTPYTQKISLRARLREISAKELEVDFQFRGLSDVILWPPILRMERKGELWKTTCLEVFLSSDSTPEAPYFEINCSPNGCWNAYSFSSYRQNMQPADIIVRLKKVHQVEDQDITYTLKISSKRSLPSEVFGLTAVVEFNNHEKSYWALSHSEEAPNFHVKAAWIGASTR